jgi:type III restriction enzyme
VHALIRRTQRPPKAALNEVLGNALLDLKAARATITSSNWNNPSAARTPGLSWRSFWIAPWDDDLARKIAELTIDRRAIEFERADYRLSETKPFSWRRNLPPLVAKKTLFNYVTTYNDFERRFAEFLDKKAADVLRFAALGTTEQGESGTQFRVDYLKPSGAIGFYHPDWVVVQKAKAREVNWIIETKGRVWEGTTAKDEALREWCERISEATGADWRYMRVNQTEFDSPGANALENLIKATN